MESLPAVVEQSGNILVVNAHPDDEILNAKVIAEVQRFAEVESREIPLHGVHLTLGEATTKNVLADEGFDPSLGDRKDEGVDGALIAGFTSVEQFLATDGALAGDGNWLVPELAFLINRVRADLIVGISKMSKWDSDDHKAAAAFTLAAAKQAYELGQGRRVINVLMLEGSLNGDVLVQHSERSRRIVGQIATANASQFRTTTEPRKDWIRISEKCYMHPADYAELGPYNIRGVSSYRLHSIGSLAVPRLAAA